MIKQLLEERSLSYSLLTNKILEIYNEKFINALKLYMKVDREIKIEMIDFYPDNHNFIVNMINIKFAIGDKVVTASNDFRVLTKENIDSFVSEPLSIVLPIKTLTKGDSQEIFDKLQEIDEFILKHSIENLHRCIKLGISDFDELTNDEQYSTILEKLTDPTDDIIKTLDPLQIAQYAIFCKDETKVIH